MSFFFEEKFSWLVYSFFIWAQNIVIELRVAWGVRNRFKTKDRPKFGSKYNKFLESMGAIVSVKNLGVNLTPFLQPSNGRPVSA